MLVTVKELRERLNLDPSKESKMAGLAKTVTTMWESQTKKLWDKRTGFTQRWETEKRDVYLWSKLINIDADATILGVPTPGIILREFQEWEAEEDKQVVDSTDYYLNRATGEIRKLRSSDWAKFVEGTINGGYTPEQIGESFPDIKEALLVQCEFMISRFAPEKLITKRQGSSHGGGGFTEYLDGPLHPLFEQTAMGYLTL